MYVKQKVKALLLYFFGFIAVGASLALIIWFISILRLRTEYREFCLEVNDVILATDSDQRRIRRGEEEYPLSSEAMNYYDQLLLASGVTVVSREEVEPNNRSIVLILGENRLTFTNVEKDGSLINLRWEAPGETRSYHVRSSQTSFMSIASYFSNYARRVGS